MRSKLLPLCAAALLTGAGGLAVADDGLIINKSMTRTIQVPAFEQEIVTNKVSEAEHAFTDMLLFYVPMQAASGETGDLLVPGEDETKADPREYYDIDGNLVETLPVAKPLVNTFVYGPMFEPEGTAFYHSFADTYAAVSLDDGQTWKQTNLSQSATLSSFNLTTDRVETDGSDDNVPADHTELLTAEDGDNAWHKPGYFWPYTNECTSCHGETLLGGEHGPSCYSCHGSIWYEEDPVNYGPTIVDAAWNPEGGVLTASGDDAAFQATVDVINPVTMAVLATDTADDDGNWSVSQNLAKAPCSIAAVSGGVQGPTVVPDGTPADCEGAPVDMPILIDYPGGTYNTFIASAGNKVLVAWPSRFCEQGQPAYSFAWDGDDSDILEDAEKGAELIAKREAVATFLGIDVLKDLYLTDLFGVSGKQGSIDFADESYPQAGVVPFGCVWTARGVLLPGDDPRTGDVTEQSHMVWTKAERLTSGRRDPNRIEVHGVKGAGFVITWQEDPDGLRPGQGEGPGEGWSGAVAHDKTDIWYSFINWTNFDWVEDPDDPTVAVNIADHPLPGSEGDDTDITTSGRPQVFVPMAVPMRLSNNDKCNAEYYAPDVITPDNKKFSYCNYTYKDATGTEEAIAKAYGLPDFCADTVDIPTGPNDELKPICVNTAGLPNIANTSSTRPRTALQGYDSDGDGAVDSGWVIVAAEESKGLGRYLFLPDGTSCPDLEKDDPDYNPDCTSDIGKNQWYFSFDMGKPATSVVPTDPKLARDSLVKSLVNQGNMLNQPEVDWRTGEFYPVLNTVNMWDFGDYNFDLYNTEIARRSSLLSQGVAKIQASKNGLAALPSWKQGAMQQGGPADTMFRRIAISNTDTTLDPAEIPCAVQAEDAKVNNWGPWKAVTVDGLPPVGCTGTIPEGCLDTLDSTRCPIVVKDPRGPKVTTALVNTNDYLRVKGKNADGLSTTRVRIRNAVTKKILGSGVDTATGTFNFAIKIMDDINVVTAVGNPYAFRNMECLHPDGSSGWILKDGSNPYYPEGICLAPATNLSSVVPDTCVDDGDEDLTDGNAIPCPAVDFTSSTYGIGDTNPILQGYIQEEGNTMRVLTWHQCPSDGTVVAGDIDPVTCEDDQKRPDEFVTLKDQSWYNPLDVSKGHRGFIDGDFVMFLYGWSPTWRLNAKGNDRYDLYIRRSFDGGQTWTTLPETFKASNGETFVGDGTVTCETYRSEVTGTQDTPEPHVCSQYPAGGNESARNVTQHKRMRITTLDPRFAPSGGPRGQAIATGCVDSLDPTIDTEVMTCDDQSEDDTDARNPSRYGVVYETGDNNTVVDGEAEPLDLYYSRAESFGDDYVVWAETDTESVDATLCYPTDPHDDPDLIGDPETGDDDSVIVGSGFCNEFDRLNTRSDTHSSEADMEMNPGGTKVYAVWAQWVFEGDRDNYEGEIVESEAMARRLWWIDDYICEGTLDPNCAWSLPGTSSDTTTE